MALILRCGFCFVTNAANPRKATMDVSILEHFWSVDVCCQAEPGATGATAAKCSVTGTIWNYFHSPKGEQASESPETVFPRQNFRFQINITGNVYSSSHHVKRPLSSSFLPLWLVASRARGTSCTGNPETCASSCPPTRRKGETWPGVTVWPGIPFKRF